MQIHFVIIPDIIKVIQRLYDRKFYVFFSLQKITSAVFTRQLTDASTDLKKILSDKIPKEQERVKAFRKNHGSTKVGEVTVDMVNAPSRIFSSKSTIFRDAFYLQS